MTVKELIEYLQTQNPEAKVEMQVEKLGDRYEVVRVKEIFYSDPCNSWLVLFGFE